jgi:NADH-quinone oxidoreductase subunit K
MDAAAGLTPNHVMIVSAILFGVGALGVMARRNALLVLMSIELMFNAANLNLAGFAWAHPQAAGQVFVVFTICVAAGEVAVGLAILIALARNRTAINVDEIHLLRW